MVPTIEQLWDRGANTAEIARKFNKRECEIDKAISQLLDKRYVEKTEKKPRKCLSCQEEFESNGNGNRVCSLCKDREAWMSSDLG
ncbi:MAG: hypothetical protein ACR2RF_24930 [Geminicoccaceae bacterium]